MTNEDRLRGLVFNGLQECGGKYPSYGVLTDLENGTSFSVRIGETIGEALDRMIASWAKQKQKQEEEPLGDTLDDPEAIKDLCEDRDYEDSRER